MKIPSTYEVMEPTSRIDFIERATVSTLSADWALSRTPFISTFMGNRAHLRDVGIGAMGRLGKVRYRAMVGSGLGANLFVGGKQNKEFIHTNGLWNWFYRLRVDAAPLDWLTVGGHGSLNHHDDMLFNDEKTVIDLRFDRYEYEFSESGDRIAQDSWTAGVNYYCGQEIRVQANYVWRRTEKQYEPDLDDDALLVSAQFAF
jgi:hypothetical protein